MKAIIFSIVLLVIGIITIPVYAQKSPIEENCDNPDDEDNCIDCDNSYPDFCIASPPPKLSCKDISKHDFKVKGSDPHGFDGDNNGIGCQSDTHPKPSPTPSPPSTPHTGGNNNGNNNDNSNNNPTKFSTKSLVFASERSDEKKFQVIVILNDTAKADSDTFRMRVIVYGPHTLNKPTLDKDGQLINIAGCSSSCYSEWGFTASKVPLNSSITACVWNPETGNKNCGYGRSNSQFGPEIISIRIPSGNSNNSIYKIQSPSEHINNIDSSKIAPLSQKFITNDSSVDQIATKMTFKETNNPYIKIYNLKDSSFVVSKNSRFCINQNCKFEFTNTDLVYQTGSNDITVSGTMKIDNGEIKKILNIESRFQPLDEREENGKTVESITGTFGLGKEPINNAEFTYNINGTLVTDGKDKTWTIEGIKCNGVQADHFNPDQEIDCQY